MIIPEHERVDLLISLLEDGNGAAFARNIGVDKARITELRRGKRSPEVYRKRIENAYPVLNGCNFIASGDIGDFPLVALVSLLIRMNEKLMEKIK